MFSKSGAGCPARQRWQRTVRPAWAYPLSGNLPVAIHVDGRHGIHAFASDPAVGKSSVIVFSPEFVLFDQMRGKVLLRIQHA